MKFNINIEKLDKGWHVRLNVPTLEDAQEVIESIGNEESGRTEACLRKNEDGTYRVKVYRSKLSQAQEFVKKTFLDFREQIAA